MTKIVSFPWGALFLLLASHAASGSSYIVFDPKGSTSTIVTGINASGSVTGYSFQSGAPFRAFIRAPSGEIDSFRVRDRGQARSTWALAINTDGAVTGLYYDEHGVQNGFIRAADGTITKIHDSLGNLQCRSINDFGDVAGFYWNGQRWVGFVRTADGAMTTIDPPNASSVSALSLNNDRFVTGGFEVGEGTSQGFLFSPDGRFTNITPPDPTSMFRGALYVSAINGPGAITGQYEMQNGVPGYLRAPDGSVTLFSVPDALGTLPIAINDQGVIAGYFNRSDGVSHGFVRSADGSIETFDPPGSTLTTVSGINLAGTIAGWFSDNTTSHGFLRVP